MIFTMEPESKLANGLMTGREIMRSQLHEETENALQDVRVLDVERDDDEAPPVIAVSHIEERDIPCTGLVGDADRPGPPVEGQAVVSVFRHRQLDLDIRQELPGMERESLIARQVIQGIPVFALMILGVGIFLHDLHSVGLQGWTAGHRLARAGWAERCFYTR